MALGRSKLICQKAQSYGASPVAGRGSRTTVASPSAQRASLPLRPHRHQLAHPSPRSPHRAHCLPRRAPHRCLHRRHRTSPPHSLALHLSLHQPPQCPRHLLPRCGRPHHRHRWRPQLRRLFCHRRHRRAAFRAMKGTVRSGSRFKSQLPSDQTARGVSASRTSQTVQKALQRLCRAMPVPTPMRPTSKRQTLAPTVRRAHVRLTESNLLGSIAFVTIVLW